MRIVSLAALIAVAASVSPARADRASGTWTGAVDLRGNYYWERSTRVVAPAASLQLEAPNGVRIGADYLVDSITSASQAAGVIADIRFTEIRHEGTLSGGYELDFGGYQLDISASLRVSREPDYLSVGGNLGFALSLDERATVLSLGLTLLHDEIRQRFRAGTGVRPNTGGGTSADTFEESFNAFAVIAGWEQTLSPHAYFQLSYQYGLLDGFLANAYRRVQVNDVFRPESHPETRHRHTLTGRLAYHIEQSRTSLHVIYRAYVDSWRIAALTPEVRIYQEIARATFFRVRWRHYRQTRASFYQDVYSPDTPEDAYVTADPKMSKFHNHLLGVQLSLGLAFLESSFLDGFRRGSIRLSFDYLWNTNRFGNGVIAQADLRIPF